MLIPSHLSLFFDSVFPCIKSKLEIFGWCFRTLKTAKHTNFTNRIRLLNLSSQTRVIKIMVHGYCQYFYENNFKLFRFISRPFPSFVFCDLWIFILIFLFFLFKIMNSLLLSDLNWNAKIKGLQLHNYTSLSYNVSR